MQPLSASTTVEHLRLRNAPVEVPVARLRFSCLLASVDLRPPAMSPSAVLVVRSMRDPLPEKITNGFAPAAVANAEWENAARAELGDLYSSAARPATGPVATSAQAVRFDDYAEMLACLALDISSSVAPAWWWRSILRNLAPQLPGAWANIWLENPQYVPAALQWLQQHDYAARVLETIAPAQACRLLLAVVYAFGLSESALGLGHMGPLASTIPEPPAAPTEPDPSGERFEAPRQPATAPVPKRDASPPWEPYIAATAVPAQLGTARRTLLGICLLLRHAPQVAASSSFAPRLRTWLAVADLSEKSPPSAAPPSVPRAAVRFDSQRKPDQPPAPSNAEQRQRPEMVTAPLPREDASTAAALPDTPMFAPAEASGIPAFSQTAPSPLQFDEEGVPTNLGGVFYLIHLLRHSQWMQFETGLSGWALLELMARCLLDDASTFSADPVWTVLAALDNRDPEVPAYSSFLPQSTYRAPDSWFVDLDFTARYVRFRSHRIELWHEEGFLTLDSQDLPIPLPGDLFPIPRHMRRAQRTASRIGRAGVLFTPELRRFLHFILPYARWRLRQALGEAPLQEILQRRGTLHASTTHVDLVMDLKQISVPARVAGMDANPGWVPELGRVIAFHFLANRFSMHDRFVVQESHA